MVNRESGQVVPLVAILIGLGAGTILLLAHLGAAATNQARAQTAADAAALAAALDGSEAAAALARANGAQLVSIDDNGGGVTVHVRLGDRLTGARAAQLVEGSLLGLNPLLIEAIHHAERLLGLALPIVSGYRSAAEQESLWEARHSNPYPVAPPGSSQHELGRAIDVSREFVPRLQAVAAVVGLCQPLPMTDPVHFVLCRTTATR